MRILILGASGMVGHQLWRGLRGRLDDVYAVLHRDRREFEWTGLYSGGSVIDRFDVSDFIALGGLLGEINPDVILNAVAVTKRRPLASSSLPAIRLNAELPHVLAEWGMDNGARVLHFSTDCVFDGKEGNYSDDSVQNATDIYGRTKGLGELHTPNAITLRTSFIGREIDARTELLEWFLAQRNKTVRGFTRVVYSGVSTLYICRLVARIIEEHPDLNGLYNLASEPITKFDLLSLARSAFNLDIDIEPDDSVVCDRSLRGDKLNRAIGITAPSWREMMDELAGDCGFYERVGRLA